MLKIKTYKYSLYFLEKIIAYQTNNFKNSKVLTNVSL